MFKNYPPKRNVAQQSGDPSGAARLTPLKSHTRPPHGVVHSAPPGAIIVSRDVLRRLYSTFAAGWPGIGLLLMRLVVGSVLIWRTTGSTAVECAAPLHVTLVARCWRSRDSCSSRACGHPWREPSSLVIETRADPARRRTSVGAPARQQPWPAALAMLGPGHWSVDARLFGWKRIEAPPRTPSSNHALSADRPPAALDEQSERPWRVV